MTEQEKQLEEAAHEYFKRGQLGLEKAADTEMAFLRGAKWQEERDRIELGLLKIELAHVNLLLKSCELALEERDNQQTKL
jgi:hypothetical protein